VLDVALVTYAGLPEGYEDDHLLVTALSARGVSAEFVCWDDPDARWASAGLVMIRSPWDYHRRLNAFLGWVDYVGSVSRLCNPPSVVHWNSHKRYLIELSELGVPTVPTALVLAGERTALGAGDHVVKPAVSIGADRTSRHATQADLDVLVATDDVLVQPYVTEIETEGELSIVCIDGAPTHTVRKVPPAGEFRTQEDLGAVVDSVPITPDHVVLARAALDAVDAATLYARVDVVPMDGELRLMELELIEPTLWLRWNPPAADTLAAAIVSRLAVDRGR
jgi:hypothetical protein